MQDHRLSRGVPGSEAGFQEPPPSTVPPSRLSLSGELFESGFDLCGLFWETHSEFSVRQSYPPLFHLFLGFEVGGMVIRATEGFIMDFVSTV